MAKASLRLKLVLWYSVIFALLLSAFGVYAYLSVSRELYKNLDTSIRRVAGSVERVIETKMHTAQNVTQDSLTTILGSNYYASSSFIGPKKALAADTSVNSSNVIWEAMLEHLFWNPKNFYIYVSDSSDSENWSIDNIRGAKDQILIESIDYNSRPAFSADKYIGTKQNLSVWRDILQSENDSLFARVDCLGHKIKVFIKKSGSRIVCIGYSADEIESMLFGLFSILLIAFPLVLIVSSIGGLVLSGMSLKSVDDLTRSANEITAKNLSLRLPEQHSDDEIGRLTKTLNAMIGRLEESFIKIRQFTSDASHELRTPLTILRGELEIALHEQKSALDYQVIIVSALDEVLRLQSVVEKLLELSRADAGYIKLSLHNDNLTNLMLDIIDDAEILAEAKDISVYTFIESDVVVPFDKVRLHQALLNMVDNAIKYTPPKGQIKIRLTKLSEKVEIFISDTGQGIPKTEIDKIFDRFYRVDKARSGEVSGAGLGLSIVKWIVEAHNGTINVSSDLGKGTAFSIMLSIKQEQNMH